ncbi:MAG: Fic family protein [Thermomicrobiales bacterium]
MHNDESPTERFIERRWQPNLTASGGRKNRLGFLYRAYLPQNIADINPALPGDVAQRVSEAEQAIRHLNTGPEYDGLEAVARQLLRAESVGSSRIEGLQISQRRLAASLFDPTGSDLTAQSVLNNIAAMETAMHIGSSSHSFALSDIVSIHKTLLNTRVDEKIAGVIRREQNWIGGKFNSPLEAEFIPPPEDHVPRLLDDLCAFINRTDLPTIVQAAIAHAQFETIHPFIDGNGRVGRCLIHVIFRRRGLATRYVPPVSIILAANARAYIGGLTDYRNGDTVEWCALFADATQRASEKAVELTVSLRNLREEWRKQAGNPRRDSAAAKLLPLLPAYPIVDVATVSMITGTSEEAARLAILSLEKARILSQITVRRWGRAWAAKEIFDLTNAFEWDISAPDDAADPQRPSPTGPWVAGH